jgi:hypothetical protein
MNVFVLGPSRSGKTPMARHLAAATGLRHVKAGAWVRERFARPAPADDAPDAERAAFVAAITRFAIDELRADPWVSIDHLAAAGLDVPSVIEGIRNPMDFVHAFDPRHDVVIWLDAANIAITPTAFERGLDVIDAYLAWLAANGLSDAGNVWRCKFSAFRRTDPGAVLGDTLDDAIEDAIKQCTLRLGPSALAQGERAKATAVRVHAEIPPMPLHVCAEYLYGMDPARVGELVPCTPFTISSYPGEAPTFQIRIADGAIFSYVPPSALIDPTQPSFGRGPELDLTDLAYHNCVDEQICVHAHSALRGSVLAYFKHKDAWLPGTYRFSVEWWTGNQVLHAILLEQGQLALLPHHKLKFGAGHAPGFAPYRKLRRTWRA